MLLILVVVVMVMVMLGLSAQATTASWGSLEGLDRGCPRACLRGGGSRG